MELTVIDRAPTARTTDRAPKISLPLDEQIDPGRDTVRQARAAMASYGVGSLLTDSNPKTDKSTKFGYLTAPLHLAPAKLSGYEMCAGRSTGCTIGCLHSSGNPIFFKPKTKARIARTRFFVEQSDLFRALLVHELRRFVGQAKQEGLHPAVRLNATSDQPWETKFPLLFTRFPGVWFYDYTKLLYRINRQMPRNYSLTFSRSEANEAEAIDVLRSGFNVAVVFGGCGIAAHPKPLPETWNGFPICDGDIHDLRFLDPADHVVGLRAKGDAIKDQIGFVVQAKSNTYQQ